MTAAAAAGGGSSPGASIKKPARRPLVRALTLALSLFVGGVKLYFMFHSSWESQQLMPKMEDAARRGHEAELAAKYPNDPLSHALYGAALADQGRYADAETEFKTAMADTDILHHQYSPRTESTIRAMLSVLLAVEGKVDEAKSVVRPACGAVSRPDFPKTLSTEITNGKLCG